MKIKIRNLQLAILIGMALATGSSAFAGSDTPATPTSSSLAWQAPTLNSWWNGSNALAGWGGLAPVMKEYGLTVTGFARQTYFGELSGGFPNQPKNNWANEEKLKFVYDFAPLFGLTGLTIESNWRYRNVGSNPGYAAGTAGPSGNFNPSYQTGGLGLRIQTQQIEYSTPNKSFTINAGWEDPYDQFLQQPLSKMFENNMINQAKGIGGQAGPGIPVINPDIASTGGSPGVGKPTKGGVRFYATSPVPWSGSYAAWGGTLKVKPTKDTYIMSGLYEAIAGELGVPAQQYTATSVYPYTSVPQSYLGQIKSGGEITPVVGANGKVIPGAMQNLGWVPAYQNNHGFNFQGAPAMSTPSLYVAVKPTTKTGGTLFATPKNASTYKSGGKYVNSPALYASSPYNQGGIGGGYSQNGLYNVNEIGWTPKFGADKLEGHYAIGGYVWGQPSTDFTPTQYTASVFNPKTGKVAYASYGSTKANPFEQNQVIYGLYLQADQQLYRVHVAQNETAGDFKNPVVAPKTFSDKGLYEFSEFSFTPPQNNALPFYFQTGLVYKGLIPHRDKDSLGIALGAGFYSSYYNDYIDSQNRQFENAVGSAYNATVPNGPVQQGSVNPTTGKVASGSKAAPLTNYYKYAPSFSSTEVLEAFYNIQVNKWASVKPYAQYIINPAGNGTVGNDLILGVSANVVF